MNDAERPLDFHVQSKITVLEAKHPERPAQLKALAEELAIQVEVLTEKESEERAATATASAARRAVNTTQAAIDQIMKGLRWTAPQSSMWAKR